MVPPYAPSVTLCNSDLSPYKLYRILISAAGCLSCDSYPQACHSALSIQTGSKSHMIILMQYGALPSAAPAKYILLGPSQLAPPQHSPAGHRPVAETEKHVQVSLHTCQTFVDVPKVVEFGQPIPATQIPFLSRNIEAYTDGGLRGGEFPCALLRGLPYQVGFENMSTIQGLGFTRV